MLRGRPEHGECHGDVKRPITRPHLPKGSVVRTDVPWEQLGVISSQLHLQLKLVFMRKKLVIYFLWGFFLCLNCQKPPLQRVECTQMPRMRFSVLVLSWMLNSRWSFTPRWIGACTEWPRAVDSGVEMINCDYAGFNASCKACVGSWLNTWRASQYWRPPWPGHSVIRTYSRSFRVIFMPVCKLQSHASTALEI